MSWNDVLITVVESLVGLILTVGLPYLFSLFAKKIKDEHLADLVADAQDVVSDCVSAVTQTFVDTLKKAGKFDEAAQKEAFAQCAENIKAILSDSAKKAIVDTVGDFEKWLTVQIEANVKAQKEINCG